MYLCVCVKVWMVIYLHLCNHEGPVEILYLFNQGVENGKQKT